jgi:hypothetical protein
MNIVVEQEQVDVTGGKKHFTLEKEMPSTDQSRILLTTEEIFGVNGRLILIDISFDAMNDVRFSRYNKVQLQFLLPSSAPHLETSSMCVIRTWDLPLLWSSWSRAGDSYPPQGTATCNMHS